ncbi:hypothetical protein V6N11_071565 [Hibiscus sabdariffa]|uniref:Putative plant transposon protein domain-containing protein n=1 Tax=Hibiscus sabdariffa TaxID=183260 RepID=A0ABR2U0F5_9ROSI
MKKPKRRWKSPSLENYGLEPIIYKILTDLPWFRFARQPAIANLDWVMEFYANNAAGDDIVTMRGRRMPANSATINNILDLPNDSPSIYAMIDILEDKDLDTIKDQLCEQGTEWNWNLMPTSHNQTVDPTWLVLINTIITGYTFNVGHVIAKELSAVCKNDKCILAFPYIISALCQRAVVPARPTDKYAVEKSGWTRKEYLRKIEVVDATPIQMVMPTPPASEQAEPSAPGGAQPSPVATPQATPATSPGSSPATTPVTPDSRQSTPDSPLGSAPSPPPSPPPAQSDEAIPFHILQLRSQLQRIEARKLQFMEETKRRSISPPTTRMIYLTGTPRWKNPICPTARRADIPESFTTQKRKEPAHADGEVAPLPTATNIDTTRRKGKTLASWILISDRSSSPKVAEQPPAKRQRKYHVISTDSDDDSSAGLQVERPEQPADPSLSNTF